MTSGETRATLQSPESARSRRHPGAFFLGTPTPDHPRTPLRPRLVRNRPPGCARRWPARHWFQWQV